MRATRIAFRALILAATAVLLPQAATAQATVIPPVVAQGLDSLVAGNRTAAVAIWGHSWTGSDTALTTTLLESLTKIDGLLGRPTGYDLVKVFDVGPNLRKFYLILRYNRQPLYARFSVYRPGREWQVINAQWNTDPSDVFPASLLAPP